MSHASRASQGIVRRASSPQAPSSPSSSPAKSIGTPGSRHLQADADEVARRATPAIVRKRAVSWLSSRFQECSTVSHGTPARKRRTRATQLGAVELRHAGGHAPELLLLLGLGSSRSSHVQSGRRKPE